MGSYFAKKKEERANRKAYELLMRETHGSSPKDRAKRLGKSVWENRFFYASLIPAMILLLIFAYEPMYGVILAFKRYSYKLGITGSPWVGFVNFNELFEQEEFWSAFRNTFVINLLKLGVSFPLTIILAVQINAIRSKPYKTFIQTCVYLPHFVSWVVVSGIIFSLFDESSGPIYNFLLTLGIKTNVFGDGNQFVSLLVLSDLWKEVGWGTIIYLAALSSIPPEYYEAAEIDGANIVQQFFCITLPELMPTMSIVLLLRVGSLIGGGFDQIYNLYNSQVYDKGDVIDTYLYRIGIGDGNFALGTAAGLFESLSNLVLLIGAAIIIARIKKKVE